MIGISYACGNFKYGGYVMSVISQADTVSPLRFLAVNSIYHSGYHTTCTALFNIEEFMIFGHISRKTEKNIFLVNISERSLFWEGSQLSPILDKGERRRLVEFLWSYFVIYVKWFYFEMKWVSYGEVLGNKSDMYIRVTLYWGCLIIWWLFYLGISCMVVVVTCVVMCGCVYVLVFW